MSHPSEFPAGNTNTASHTLIVPFAATGDSPDVEALKALQLPNLQALLSGLKENLSLGGDPYSASAPHELALAHEAGLLHNAAEQDGQLPWAALASGTQGTPCAWWVPCHFQVGMEQVSLLPPERLVLDDACSRALHAALAPLCAEDGVQLHWQQAGRWLAVGERLRGLRCAGMDRVVGRSLDIWQPRADAAHSAQLAWLQRLQSEAQMLFYTHPANDSRDAQRLPAINGLWVEGCGSVPNLPTQPLPEQVTALRTAALLGSASDWAQAWASVDAGPLARLLAHQRQGTPVTVWLCGERWARRFGTPTQTPGWGQRLSAWLSGRTRPTVADILSTL